MGSAGGRQQPPDPPDQGRSQGQGGHRSDRHRFRPRPRVSLWRAAWCFFDEGDATAETWVRDKATAVLQGQASTVAASIRRKATCLRLGPAKRANADTCADYLLRKCPYLDYATTLEKGWPIATGVIEGACRHLVKDRMDITGARWSVEGAEAVLKLRALRTNQDFPAYWRFHLSQERQRVHAARYANGVIPHAA